MAYDPNTSKEVRDRSTYQMQHIFRTLSHLRAFSIKMEQLYLRIIYQYVTDLSLLLAGLHLLLQLEEVGPDAVVDGLSQEVEGCVRSYVVLAS